MVEAHNEAKKNNRPTLVYPCGDAPEPGAVREIAPGVLWIRMPMPFVLTHINLWALEDGDGWTIVDTGLQTSDTTAAWGKLFSGPLGAKRASRVLVTHMHPDHVGMAGWLTRKFGCRLWMTRLEYLTCRTLVADTGREAPEDGIRFYRQAGWSEHSIENYRARFGNFGKMTHALPDSYRRLQDGESLNIGSHQWKVVVGNGHSPEHACLYCPDLKLLISGDQVLPRISSNVSVFPTEPDADPMGDWLASLEKLKKEVPNDVLVLPAHNEPFRGLHERLDYLESSQLDALERLRAVLRQPQRAVDVFPTLFSRPITAADHSQLSLATGESVAHLNYLIRRSEAVMQLDGEGVAWYRAAS
ncbi:MBL fold metallo-hydrolase [Paralcaligenes sp. KSB-10]|uniref:MBL fold metallo-hydrolase n=1 Tax=Paralcaligenes sp. KSB-10 TaxID=2901142 RepID=UPI001E5B0849|nr:MBL fold metallo-hydrolase [Paralcaligenes sp. KSB-10]UHL65651.1 MBL fold metallo-hydrolase [Paralcaligenes sp. KSB-10]